MVAPLSNTVAIKSNLVSNAYTLRKYPYLSHQSLMIQKYLPDYTHPTHMQEQNLKQKVFPRTARYCKLITVAKSQSTCNLHIKPLYLETDDPEVWYLA